MEYILVKANEEQYVIIKNHNNGLFVICDIYKRNDRFIFKFRLKTTNLKYNNLKYNIDDFCCDYNTLVIDTYTDPSIEVKGPVDIVNMLNNQLKYNL
jgi:hypothetical protein